ncbi:oligosaccharide flippase family protein, partial [Escherichia coli]|uniref:oligosaccharide flippase family protein n=1 Tax=Escherichia coli TaxID=562 RepID=UPI000CCB345A
TLATPAELGYLSLSIFLLQAPMSLIGNAIGQVYLANAPAAHREGRLGSYTFGIARTLSRIVAVPMATAAILAPILFTVVFGPNWERAGVLVTWMAPWFALQFITSPVSTALHVT